MEGVEIKEGREREKGYGNDLEVKKKRRNGEEKKGEGEKCGWAIFSMKRCRISRSNLSLRL